MQEGAYDIDREYVSSMYQSFYHNQVHSFDSSSIRVRSFYPPTACGLCSSFSVSALSLLVASLSALLPMEGRLASPPSKSPTVKKTTRKD